MTSPFTEQFTGLYATPELVGRESILREFERILRDPSPTPRLVFLRGVGGIGKTRLLQKALEITRGLDLDTCSIAEAVMDFYHIDLHVPIGITQAIFEILPTPFGSFKTYESAYAALNRARLSGNVVEISQLREDATNKFDHDLKQLTAKRRVVLALDTVECVVYGLKDRSGEIPFADSWNWLVEHLPTWQNVVIFVAGREEANSAIEKIKAQKSILVEEIEVGPFDLDESLQYFDEVTKLLEEKKEYQLASRLKNLPLDFKKGVHFYSRKGLPILLSLLVDYLSFPGEGDIEMMLREIPHKELSEEDYWQYEEALIKRLQEKELGQTLIALGYVPKGADEVLLADLLDVPIVEARRRLNEVHNFSVIKVRPEDQRVFLHDEMYALLQRHVYDSPFNAGPKNNAFDAIKKYYQNQRERISQRLNELYAPVEVYGKESLDLKTLGQVHIQYQALLTEIMYYFLRQDLGRGFRAYYRFSHEAIMARDVLMDLQLQAELLSYLSKPPLPPLESDISVKMILESLKARPPARAWALGQYEIGIAEADSIIDKVKKDWEQEYPSLLAALHAWAASLHILRGALGDHEKGEKHLQQTYSLLPEGEFRNPFDDSSIPNTLLWHKEAIAAMSHRIHGYLKRVQGFMEESVGEYQQAATLLRELDIRIEMAVTKNDMGFAQAEIGSWDDGRANVRDALELRRELGPRVPVALSLNTLATIDVREGQYLSARQNSTKALAIFRAFSFQRGIGMALTTLADATRRLASSDPLFTDEEKIKYLREARDYVREASIVFDELKETSRRVEALIIIGCACRDWVRLLKINPQTGDNPARLLRESKDALWEAAQLAEKTGLIYHRVDALVNLAWLEYNTLENDDEVSEKHAVMVAIQAVETVFPPDEDLEKQPQIWRQKGKLYVLKGHLAFREFQQQRKKVTKGLPGEILDSLKHMAENYALALDYNSRFAIDFQGIRHAKNSMYANLRYLNGAEMRVVCNRIQELYSQSSVIQDSLTARGLWQT